MNGDASEANGAMPHEFTEDEAWGIWNTALRLSEGQGAGYPLHRALEDVAEAKRFFKKLAVFGKPS